MHNEDAIANATIIEDPESVSRRGHNLQPLSQTEQVELREVAQRTWAAEGYIVIPAANFLGEYTDVAPHADLAAEKTALTPMTPMTPTIFFQPRHNWTQTAKPGVKSLL